MYFYPRPPRGGRLQVHHLFDLGKTISIHALREEGDAGALIFLGGGGNFYPRPPRGGRRRRELCRRRRGDFYPRPPRGGRRNLYSSVRNLGVFLSTPSARRATWKAMEGAVSTTFLSTPSARRATFQLPAFANNIPISIHALREEGDQETVRKRQGQVQFLSTPSARRATCPA